MTNRVTKKNLQATVARINRITGAPAEFYTKIGGQFVSNMGHYYLDNAIGGVALHRIANTAGDAHDVLRVGHVSKRALQSAMFAFIEGIEVGQQITLERAVA